MEEFIVVSLTPPPATSAHFGELLREWASRGYRVGRYKAESSVEVLVPIDDTAWRQDLDAAKQSGHVDTWRAAWIEQKYSDQEHAEAPLFRLNHTGYDINFPSTKGFSGVCHIADVDVSNACASDYAAEGKVYKCGAGARQSSSLRLSGRELDKAGRFASIWIGSNTFFLLSQSLVDQLEKECGALPLRPIEPLKTVPKEQWWQLDPQQLLPLAACRAPRAALVKCPGCGAARLTYEREPDQPVGPYYGVTRELADMPLAPVVFSPFWGGWLSFLKDGRVASFPERDMWVRGDVGRALAAKKIKGLDVIPIIWST